jgi:hypothetical protein
MDFVVEFADGVFLLKFAFAAFFAILFLQSGLDKLLNFKDNLSWLTGHFSKSPLRGTVPLLLVIVTLSELSAGALSLAGFVQLLVFSKATLAFLGNVLAVCSLVFLFFGQRLAKDYAGAASIVSYFIAASFGLLVQAW